MNTDQALLGRFDVATNEGTIGCRPVFQLWVDLCNRYDPNRVQEITGVPSAQLERTVGFVSITLHRSLDRRRIVNYVQWQSRELLEKAHHSPEFRKEWDEFDRLTADISPSLYEIVEVIESAS
jgi:hypothetical protein